VGVISRASLDIRSRATSVIDSSQIENHSSHHLYQSGFRPHLVIARLACENINAVEKNFRMNHYCGRFRRIGSASGSERVSVSRSLIESLSLPFAELTRRPV